MGWNYNVASPLCMHGHVMGFTINDAPHCAFFSSLPLKTKPTGCNQLKRRSMTLVYLPVALCYPICGENRTEVWQVQRGN
jgi:hypothetical protein